MYGSIYLVYMRLLSLATQAPWVALGNIMPQLYKPGTHLLLG